MMAKVRQLISDNGSLKLALGLLATGIVTGILDFGMKDGSQPAWLTIMLVLVVLGLSVVSILLLFGGSIDLLDNDSLDKWWVRLSIGIPGCGIVALCWIYADWLRVNLPPASFRVSALLIIIFSPISLGLAVSGVAMLFDELKLNRSRRSRRPAYSSSAKGAISQLRELPISKLAADATITEGTGKREFDIEACPECGNPIFVQEPLERYDTTCSLCGTPLLVDGNVIYLREQ